MSTEVGTWIMRFMMYIKVEMPLNPADRKSVV